MLLVQHLVLLVHLAHLFDLVEVDDETALVRVVLFDTLSTENSEVIRAVEVLQTLVMLLAYQAINALLVLKVDVAEYRISFH